MDIVNSSNKKERALVLRHLGKSYSEICKTLGVPKSTLSGWLKTAPFSEEVKKDQLVRVKQIWAKNIQEFNAQRHALYLRETEILIDKYASEISVIKERDLFFLFMGLFLGEGSKKERWAVRLANTDPNLIRLAMRFLRGYCEIPIDKFHPWVHIHPNINEETSRRFWSDVTKIPINQIQIQRIVSSASKGIKPKSLLPYGTFHICVRDVHLAKKIKGWMKGVVGQVNAMPE